MTSTQVSAASPVASGSTAPSAATVAAVPDLGALVFEGADAAAFLQGQLSNDVSALAVGGAHWTSYNSPKGRMLATLLLWREGPASYRAWVAADLAEPLRKRLAMFVLRAKVTVTDRTTGSRFFGVAGPGAHDAVQRAFGVAPDNSHGLTVAGCTLVATPDGRVIIDAPSEVADAMQRLLTAHARPAPASHWHWYGIRAGVPVITGPTQDLFVPQNANWDLVGGINFRKGCYPGQEIVARMQYLGRMKERLFAFHVDGPPPATATPLYHATFGAQACGIVVNAAAAPEGGSDLLAVVQWTALGEPALHLGSPDGPVLASLPLPYDVPVPSAANRHRL